MALHKGRLADTAITHEHKLRHRGRGVRETRVGCQTLR